nr:MAG TPA: hypothetical protein [Caudoviricetes sp.]
MASGGSRARSGPAANPNSARSDARGVQFRVLAGINTDAQPAPRFSLPPMALWEQLPGGGRRFREEPTRVRYERELALWAWAWSQPQAEVWHEQPWFQYLVAQWVRIAVSCEEENAKAGDKTAMLRLADQIGMTPAGLAMNRWQIGDGATLAPKPAPEKAKKKSSRDRMAALEVVTGGRG